MSPSLPAALPSASAPVHSEEALLLRRLLQAGFLVRAGLALVLEWTGYSQRFAPDEETYARHGWQMALYWSEEILTRPWRFSTDEPHGYFYLNALSFSVFGRTEIPLKLVNAFIGAFATRYVYFIARDLFGTTVARRTAILYAFFPSLILWSALNIRDVWVIFLIVFVSWKSLEVVRGYSHVALASVFAAVFALTLFRDYLFFVVALPPLLAFLIGGRGHLERNFILALVGGMGVLLLVHQGVGATAAKHMSLEAMSKIRQDMATGGSAFHDTVDISTPGSALAFLPVGIAYFLFSPFPWQITSVLKLFSVPEMLLVYGLAPAMVRGFRYAIRFRFRDSLQVLLLTGLLTVSYSLGEGNVGTLYRHRAQAIVFYLMFAAVGLELKSESRQARAAAA